MHIRFNIWLIRKLKVNMIKVTFGIILLLNISALFVAAKSERQKKLFSLFNVVSFANEY